VRRRQPTHPAAHHRNPHSALLMILLCSALLWTIGSLAVPLLFNIGEDDRLVWLVCVTTETIIRCTSVRSHES
jgi:hypothetical protein